MVTNEVYTKLLKLDKNIKQYLHWWTQKY